VSEAPIGKGREAGIGRESRVERLINHHASSGIHLFLSLLAVVIFAAAVVSAFTLILSDFPRLWQRGDEYRALQSFIHDILLIAIAGELGLLLLFHRTSAAIEVIIFVIARKMVSPDINSVDMLAGGVSLAVLLLVRFRVIPGPPQ
jgi:hypothetical protein